MSVIAEANAKMLESWNKQEGEKEYLYWAAYLEGAIAQKQEDDAKSAIDTDTEDYYSTAYRG